MYNNGNSSKNVTGSSVVDGTLENADYADNAISGDKIDGGIISNFQSTGIDDRLPTGKVLTLSDDETSVSNNFAMTATDSKFTNMLLDRKTVSSSGGTYTITITYPDDRVFAGGRLHLLVGRTSNANHEHVMFLTYEIAYGIDSSGNFLGSIVESTPTESGTAVVAADISGVISESSENVVTLTITSSDSAGNYYFGRLEMMYRVNPTSITVAST
jgi:hypothetical protein